MSRFAAPGLLLVIGSTLFVVGAAIGVPRVFTERDPQKRLVMLREHMRSWQIAQPLYGLGPAVVAIGVGSLAVVAPRVGYTTFLFSLSCTASAVGALFWGLSLYRRAVRVEDFAFGNLPGWPFRSYVWLTIGGLATLGAGLVTGGISLWLGWLTVAGAVLCAAAYVRFKDIPPFVFYILFVVIGVVLL